MAFGLGQKEDQTFESVAAWENELIYEERIEKLEKRIHELEAENAELRARCGSTNGLRKELLHFFSGEDDLHVQSNI